MVVVGGGVLGRLFVELLSSGSTGLWLVGLFAVRFG